MIEVNGRAERMDVEYAVGVLMQSPQRRRRPDDSSGHPHGISGVSAETRRAPIFSDLVDPLSDVHPVTEVVRIGLIKGGLGSLRFRNLVGKR